MTLDEAIKHCQEVAEEQEKLCKINDSFNFSQPKWKECAKEHNQLADWLKDYKRLKEQEPKTGHCKDCKHWKDSDGVYRRGVDAESKCPMNTKAVHDGDGYCYLFSKNE